LERAFWLARKIESKIMAIRNPTTHNYKDGSVVAPSLPQPTRLIPPQLEEKGENEICYICDSKYTKGHKYAETKLFYIDCEVRKRGYTLGTNPRERRNEFDHII